MHNYFTRVLQFKFIEFIFSLILLFANIYGRSLFFNSNILIFKPITLVNPNLLTPKYTKTIHFHPWFKLSPHYTFKIAITIQLNQKFKIRFVQTYTIFRKYVNQRTQSIQYKITRSKVCHVWN